MMSWFLYCMIGALLISSASAQNHRDIIRINEFLPNPSGNLESEWIELYCGSDSTIDLSDYHIGDAIGWENISDTSIMISSPVFIILAQDKASFLDYYFDFVGVVVEPPGWKALNNSGGDIVRLGYFDTLAFDSFYYEKVFPDNRSWERYVDGLGVSFWGKSFDYSGSSLGRENNFNPFRPDDIKIAVSPDPFSPNCDGFEDISIISYDIPPGSSFDLFIYDLSGRKLKTLHESSETIPGEIEWDGTDDNNKVLDIGIYILYARVNGEDDYEQKRTIVIAP